MDTVVAPLPLTPTASASTMSASAGRSLMDQAISRAAGARRIDGNSVRLLRNAAENYPAWLDAIAAAERYVYFEAYIMCDDVAGRRFADALIAKARDGVSVRLLYDWLGAFGKTPSRFWDSMRAAGVEVRCFNPFTLSSPLGWVHRDHRKSVVVDGTIGFITGLCVGDAWVGDPERGIAPWRDTGVEVRGPAVAEIARAFSRVWSVVGPPIPAADLAPREEMVPAGDTSVRVVASEPWRAKLLRIDELIAGAAREMLWLTDAYYAGMPSHVQALRAAAMDGVDVRLLVPGGTDIPLLRPLSQAGYRPLLEAGVRVFEWNGPMMHAKTAVADCRLARVGSSNLNIASFLGNYELDAVIEDVVFAQAMVDSYLDDIANATEVVLHARKRGRATRAAKAVTAAKAAQASGVAQPVLPDAPPRKGRMRDRRRGSGSAGRGVAGAIRLGNTVSAAVTDRRVLAAADSRAVAVAGAILVAVALVTILWPLVLAIPFALLAVWFGGAMLLQSFRLRKHSPTTKMTQPAQIRTRTEDPAPPAPPA